MLALVPFRDPVRRRFTELCGAEVAVRERGLLAIGCEFPDLWAGRQIYDGRRLRRRVALYRDEVLVAVFDDPHMPIVDLAIHPTDPILAIATGAISDEDHANYDGAVLLWNWETGEVRGVLDERCLLERIRWEGDRLAVFAHDALQEGFVTAVIDVRSVFRVADLQPCSNAIATHERGTRNDARDRLLDELAIERRLPIRDLAFTAEGWLAAACSDRVELWSPALERLHVIPTDRHVFELLPQLDRLLVHKQSFQRSELYELRGRELEHWMDLPGRYTCSVDAAGRILARDIDREDGRRDLLFTPSRKILVDHDLGGRYLRIDGADEHFLLRGDFLHVIDAGDIRARQAFRWNLDGRRDEGTAALFDGDLIACNRIRHFDDRGAVWIERRDIASGAQRWARRVRAVATHLIRWPALDAVVAALVDGSLVVVDGDGTVLLDEPFELDGTPTLPTALAVHEETLVIGTIDGRIAMRSLR